MSTKKTKKTAAQPRKTTTATSSANTRKAATPRASAKPRATAKTPEQSTERAKRTKRVKRAIANKRAASKRATSTPEVTRRASADPAEDRRAQVALAAYFRAEARGFAPGEEVQDWVAAEGDIDARTAGNYVPDCAARVPKKKTDPARH